VVTELRPPMLDDQGLALALDWYASQVTKRTGVLVAVLAPGPDERPAPRMEIALFRIAQEALNNVIKHASATRVEIILARQGAEYWMTVEDDGVGFGNRDRPTQHLGLGMVTMRERSQAVGGSFEVRALPGSGTMLTAR
jgi:two-component system sensor histidine kinase UhpB